MKFQTPKPPSQIYYKLYFFKNHEKCFALHYDGFYEINERKKKNIEV